MGFQGISRENVTNSFLFLTRRALSAVGTGTPELFTSGASWDTTQQRHATGLFSDPPAQAQPAPNRQSMMLSREATDPIRKL